MRVLGYGSRTLTEAEKKYHSSKLEFLALKWAVSEHFRDYLYYSKHFDIYTDFNPLTYLSTTAKLNATGQRWVNELSDYHFTIHYKPGNENVVADALSRYPKLTETNMKDFSNKFEESDVKATFDSVLNQKDNDETWIAAINSISTTFNEIQNQILYDAGDNPKQIEWADIVAAQHRDESIKMVIDCKISGSKPINHTSVDVKRLLREWERLEVEKNALYRKRNNTFKQLVLPKCLKPLVYHELHVNMGHIGTDRTYQVSFLLA